MLPGGFAGSQSDVAFQTWSRLDRDQQELSRQLEAVEGGTPSVGLVEESEDRLADRIALYQVSVAGISARRGVATPPLETPTRS